MRMAHTCMWYMITNIGYGLFSGVSTQKQHNSDSCCMHLVLITVPVLQTDMMLCNTCTCSCFGVVRLQPHALSSAVCSLLHHMHQHICTTKLTTSSKTSRAPASALLLVFSSSNITHPKPFYSSSHTCSCSGVVKFQPHASS
jgi:hypothetical protein